MEVTENLQVQKQRYKYLAYCVVRDAIGFYFGIPKFLAENEDLAGAYEYVFNSKIKNKQLPLSQLELERAIRHTKKFVTLRLTELREDFNHCEQVLTSDNVWLQLLDLTPTGLKQYLDSLSPGDIEDLAIVPKWTAQDHALGRSYINDDFTYLDDERADEFN